MKTLIEYSGLAIGAHGRDVGIRFLLVILTLCPIPVMAEFERASRDQAGPRELSDSQLDRVTAAGTTVSVNAHAVSISEQAVAMTEVNSSIEVESPIRGGALLDRGFGTAMALACCESNTHVSVSLSATSDREFVSVAGRVVEHTVGGYSLAFGWIYIFAFDRPSFDRPSFDRPSIVPPSLDGMLPKLDLANGDL
jgi:hypothetical protein